MKTLIIALYNYQGKGLDSWHDHGAGMTYTAAKANDCDVHFLDMKKLSSDEELQESLKGYDLISFGLKSSYYSIGMKVLKYAKELGSKTLVAGYHVTAAPEQLLENPHIDWVFHGESEITFSKFLKDPVSFPREIWGEKPSNLDALPFMDRSVYLNQLEPVSGWWRVSGRDNMISVMAARGCPYRCGFCQPIERNHFGKVLRRRSVDSIIKELKWLKDLYHPDCVMIHDDTFLIQPKWLEEFIERYPEIGLPFWAAGRADGICKHPDLVSKLIKVGWELVSIGFESGSQRILDLMKKDTTVEQNLKSAKIVKSLGAKLYANYMLGLPWETREDIQATMKMADEIKAEIPSWAFFTPYPGCEMGDECIKKDWSLLDRNNYNRCPSGRKVKYVDYGYLDKALKGFREKVKVPFCDIIVPSYENEQIALDCINSIRENTKPSTYRLIWVDNASKNITKIKEALSSIDHLLIEMPSNKGFVGAVNKGLEASNAPAVCLLNSDTRVSSNWLEKMLITLFKTEDLGIIGALTNRAPGDGMDSHHNLKLHNKLVPESITDLNEVNRHLETHYSGRTTPISFVAFLCAIIKREVINKVGHLDPNYDMGMWDDNDYNIATRRAGFRAELSLDTCIYHRGRATFSILQEKENFDVDKLLKKNKAYLDNKWKAAEALIISRAIYNLIGDSTSPGVLTLTRLSLMQKYFVNSLRNQTDMNFVVYLFVGAEGNETTKRIKALDWSDINIQFINIDNDFTEWKSSISLSGNIGRENDSGSPEDLVRRKGHPTSSIMARLDTDDWVAPGWVAHMRYMARTIDDPRFLINYQVIGQLHDGRLYQFSTLYNRGRTSPFLSLVQKEGPKLSPYETTHIKMERVFDIVYTIPPSYVFSVVHKENRSTRISSLNELFYLRESGRKEAKKEIIEPIHEPKKLILPPAKSPEWKNRMIHVN